MSVPPRIIINPWDDELETANSQSQKTIDKWSILKNLDSNYYKSVYLVNYLLLY